jgi:hypothetical protein
MENFRHKYCMSYLNGGESVKGYAKKSLTSSIVTRMGLEESEEEVMKA